MKPGQIVVKFLEDLERISQRHEELTDTDVRESIHLALNYYFVWGRTGTELPRCYGMFSKKGDATVSAAVRRFLKAAERSRDFSAIAYGQDRLNLLQAPSAKTASGALYDELIGHRSVPLDPEPLPGHLFVDGEYDDDDEE